MFMGSSECPTTTWACVGVSGHSPKYVVTYNLHIQPTAEYEHCSDTLLRGYTVKAGKEFLTLYNAEKSEGDIQEKPVDE